MNGIRAIHESPLRVRRNDEVAAQRRRWPFSEVIKFGWLFAGIPTQRIHPLSFRRQTMPTPIPEGTALRKAVHWISKTRAEGPPAALLTLIDQACVRFNLSPKDCEFLHRFFSDSQDNKKS
jgi:hypothetical protein